METIKEIRTGRITKVSRQFAKVFVRLGTHVRVESQTDVPVRKVVAEVATEKQIDDGAAPDRPKRKYTRRKKTTEADS